MRTGLHSDFYLFKAELKDTTQVTSVRVINNCRVIKEKNFGVTSPSSSSCKVRKAGKKKGKMRFVDLFILNCLLGVPGARSDILSGKSD